MGGMYIELKTDNLQELVQQYGTVMVQYGTGWCGNCRIMKPKFKKLAAGNEATAFVYVDAEKFPVSRQMAQVSNLPTFAAFKNGQLVNQVQTNQAELLKLLYDEVTRN